MPTPQTISPSLIDRLDAWLPQTQCTRCGYPRCRAYAEAITRDEAKINQCPPGGEATVQGLAALLNVPSTLLDPNFGRTEPRARAVIDETLCIGCRKCIDACPVDAIVGAHKRMHTVIALECTGCALCLPPCPVDCISLVSDDIYVSGPWPEYGRAEADRWRVRTESRLARLNKNKLSRRNHERTKTQRASVSLPPLPTDRERIRADIRAAVKRVREKKTRASRRTS